MNLMENAAVKTFLIVVLLGCALPLAASAKLVREAVEAAAKVSGKTMTKASKKAAVKILAEAFAKYGDDALRTARRGGLEAIGAGGRYGDDFWKLARGAAPEAVRSFALHADDLMPLARRLGPDFLRLEGKVPGLGAKAVAVFGDDAARALAQSAPPDDIAKLLAYSGKADSPATRELLLDTYRKGGGKFLGALDWKTVMATGLSAAMITAAYQVSDGVGDGIRTVAEKHPEQFAAAADSFVSPFKWLLWAVCAALVVPPLGALAVRWCRRRPKR